MSICNEQFEVLSNSLRIFPERILALNYYLFTVNDPEEGISNIESAFRDVLNQFYGMMCSLKDNGHISSLYEHDAITSLLCMRHAVQHRSGAIKNKFRDFILNNDLSVFFQIEYSTSDKSRGRNPFPVSITWFEDKIKNSNYSNKWDKISKYWQLESIKKVAGFRNIDWKNVYIDATSLITEAVRVLCREYKEFFSPMGFDSKVYFDHFAVVMPLDKEDFELIT